MSILDTLVSRLPWRRPAPSPLRVLTVTAGRPALLERLLVPRTIAEHTLDHLRAAGARDCEEFAFWSGHVLLDGRTGVVTRAFRPRSTQGSHHLAIQDDAQLLTMSDLVHEHDELVLCQLHTHPGQNAYHSTADDHGAFTDEVGFLSLVLPRFGAEGLETAEAFRRTTAGWAHEGRPIERGLVRVFDDTLCYHGGAWHAA